MQISYDITRTMTRGLLLTCVLLLLAGGWSTAAASEQDWLDAMVRAVLVEQAKEGGSGHPFAPYLGQLTMVRAHLINGESEAVYRAMNRFMEMLQAREEGISDEAADRLFDYCYLLTPAQYHDVSRHLNRLSRYQAGALPA
jgi:hypothetical protein